MDRVDYIGDLVYFGKYCFSCPSIAKCIQEKYWVGEKGFELFWVQLGNRFFFFFSKGSVQSWSCVVHYDCQSTGNMHTRHTTRVCDAAAWKCDFTTSTKYSGGRSEWGDITHSGPGEISIFCASVCPPPLFFFYMAQQLCCLHYGLNQVCCQGNKPGI